MFSTIISILCGVIMPCSLFVFGLFFAYRVGFFYILHPIKTAKKIFASKGGMKSLSVALGATLGIGNIVGVSSAIISGGAGAIFWMVVSAYVAMSLKYAEVFLSMKFKIKVGNSSYGGAPYYISNACEKSKKKKISFIFGGIFAGLCVVNSLSTGNLVQINSVSPFFENSKLFFAIIFAFFVFLALIKGTEKISRITSVLMPILTVSYILVSLFIIIRRRENIGYVFSEIFKSAFSVKSVGGGIFGYGMSRAIRYGVCRGVLSNEAGVGSATIAHASSSLDAESQACLGIFEVFIDTVILCPLSALVILLNSSCSSDALSLVVSAYEKGIGIFGKYFIIAICILFAYATVICQYYYGEKALDYFNAPNRSKRIFGFIFIFVSVLSCFINSSTMWLISDIILSVMTVFNLFFVFLLRKEIPHL